MSDRDEIEIVVPTQETWDSEKEEFVYVKGQTIRMKHSLLSISKWEMKWKKPFLKPGYNMTEEETIDYYKCMTITPNVDPNIYYCIPVPERLRIKQYIEDPMSAYKPRNRKRPPSRAAIVSERIYYWMTSNNIPHSYEKWHLNRLLNLLDIASEESGPQEKLSTAEVFRRNHDLNQARRRALGSRG